MTVLDELMAETADADKVDPSDADYYYPQNNLRNIGFFGCWTNYTFSVGKCGRVQGRHKKNVGQDCEICFKNFFLS